MSESGQFVMVKTKFSIVCPVIDNGFRHNIV